MKVVLTSILVDDQRSALQFYTRQVFPHPQRTNV